MADRRADDGAAVRAPARCSRRPACIAYGDRALLGMLGARPFALAEDPILPSTTDKVAARLGVRPPQLFLIPGRLPPRFCLVGRGPRKASRSPCRRGPLTGAASPRKPRGGARAPARDVRRRDVLIQTFVVLFAAMLVEMSRVGGWLSRSLPLRARPDRIGVRPPAPDVPSASCQADATRGERPGTTRTTWRTRSCASTERRVVQFAALAGHGAALPRSTPSRTTASRGCSRHTRRSTTAYGGCGNWEPGATAVRHPYSNASPPVARRPRRRGKLPRPGRGGST